MWVYQFGYLDELGYPVSTNYALDELGSFGDRPVWINPLWFGSAIQTCHKEAPGRAPRASGLPKYPPARPRQDAPQRPRTARIKVRLAPKATECCVAAKRRSVPIGDLSRCSKLSQLFDNLVGAQKERFRDSEAECFGGL